MNFWPPAWTPDCLLVLNLASNVVANLVPFENLVIACDAARRRGNNPDRVVGPSLTTRLISRLTVRGDCETTLDLGTGGGVLALEAASYSKRVVGTDVNERALEFAAFNAALNGISNVSFASGDAFAPVEGQRFSRIIANPPFFITPAKKFTYSDSPLELDGFSRRLAREAPSCLEEGGFFQMISEWVQLVGQSWEQRIREWAEGSGCDVLVLRCLQLAPMQYVETRLREAELLHSTESENLFATHLAYLQERNVESIVGGIITMRKRAGGNWFSTIVGEPASNKLGDAVRERFETITFAATRAPETLLNCKFHLADDVVLEQRTAPKTTGWETISCELVKTAGFKDRLGLDAVVSQFVYLFDGQRTLAEIAKLISESLHVSQLEAEKQCLRLAQRLLQSSFIKSAGLPHPSR